ncbi:MAG: hypothetical protein AMXMBFR58_06520 [Phycisphaerae bacterium]
MACEPRQPARGAAFSAMTALVVAGCSTAMPVRDPERWAEPFPGVWIDAKERVVEFDGVVPIDPHDPETPTIFLEVVVCSPNSREHESLVVTRALPSHVHAALLLLGAQPGRPGHWTRDDRTRRMIAAGPEGPVVDVMLVTRSAWGGERESDPATWIVDVRDGRTLRDIAGGDMAWVFAGSVVAPRPDGPGEYYKADIEGTLVGLATFGTETLGWQGVFSPDSAVQAPEWIANVRLVPAYNDPVTVRLRVQPAGER